MPSKIGPYDFNTLHIVKRPDGFLELYERRLQRAVVSSSGKPKRIVPDGVGYESWHRLKDKETDRIVTAYTLVPVNLN